MYSTLQTDVILVCYKSMNGLYLGIALPFLGTTLGAACVFLMKREIPGLVQKLLTGFAAGVMVAASVWSLLIPSIEMTGKEGPYRCCHHHSGCKTCK